MENLHLSVIPAQAGIHWHQALRESPFREGVTAFVRLSTSSRGEKDLPVSRYNFKVPSRRRERISSVIGTYRPASSSRK